MSEALSQTSKASTHTINEFGKSINEFLNDTPDASNIQKPLDQVIWNDEPQASQNDLLAAAAFGRLDRIVLMWCTSSDPELRLKAAVLILKRPIDIIESDMWAKRLEEYSKRFQKSECDARTAEIKLAKSASREIEQKVAKLYGSLKKDDKR